MRQTLNKSLNLSLYYMKTGNKNDKILVKMSEHEQVFEFNWFIIMQISNPEVFALQFKALENKRKIQTTGNEIWVLKIVSIIDWRIYDFLVSIISTKCLNWTSSLMPDSIMCINRCFSFALDIYSKSLSIVLFLRGLNFISQQR